MLDHRGRNPALTKLSETFYRTAHQYALRCSQRDKETELHFRRLAERAPPTADDLAINTHDVPHERVDSGIRDDTAQPLGNGRAIAEADKIFIEVRQQVGDSRRACGARRRHVPPRSAVVW